MYMDVNEKEFTHYCKAAVSILHSVHVPHTLQILDIISNERHTNHTFLAPCTYTH